MPNLNSLALIVSGSQRSSGQTDRRTTGMARSTRLVIPDQEYIYHSASDPDQVYILYGVANASFCLLHTFRSDVCNTVQETFLPHIKYIYS